MKMEIEWLKQDMETLAHTSKLTLGGKTTITPQAAVVSPHHAMTRTDEVKLKVREPFKTALVVAGETLGRVTLKDVGYSQEATDALIGRVKDKMLEGRINLAYTRIPSGYEVNGVRQDAPPITDLRASALVDVQLEAGAKLIIPPVPTDISNINVFNRALERTVVSVQTFDESCEYVGHIPTTDRLDLVPDMVKAYLKQDVRFFSTDFSGASNRPSLMRTVVGTIRKSLKVKRKAKEGDETYYLHVFNASAAKKSVEVVTPLSDIIIHPYGVDSTSGVMWGGGTLDVEKLRYYATADYGSYRRKAIAAKGTSCTCRTCSDFNLEELYAGSPAAVVERLKHHRAYAYADECVKIAERIGADQPTASYTPYLMTKTKAVPEVVKILRDVNEVQASL